jgi:hypothetical protein
MIINNDKEIIRKLATKVAEIAALPVQEEKRSMWSNLNALKPNRPMVMIDQVCWNEMNIDDELTLQCRDDECRDYEETLRRILFQWKRFPVDMVVEPFIRVPKAINNSGFGITIEENTAATDSNNEVVSHLFKNQFETEEDLEKIQTPVITHDRMETERRETVAHELFDGLLDVNMWGADPPMSIWDPLAKWMGVENALFSIIDKREYVHKILNRMTDGYLSMLDQLEEQGLLCGGQSLIHCTGAYTEDLPASGYDPDKPRTKDLWMFTMAQVLGSVSPKMFQEFEITYTSKICNRFGLVYYGCCDPLHDRMKQVRMLPNVRKVSMSPWTDEERGAAEIGSDFVFSRKPNPVSVAMDDFDANAVRKDLTNSREICVKNGCPTEYILKDISTVRYQPLRLTKWANIAMQVVGG